MKESQAINQEKNIGPRRTGPFSRSGSEQFWKDPQAGTWSDHTTLIEAVPRRYNVPRNQTQLLVSGNIEGPYRTLVDDSVDKLVLGKKYNP